MPTPVLPGAPTTQPTPVIGRLPLGPKYGKVSEYNMPAGTLLTTNDRPLLVALPRRLVTTTMKEDNASFRLQLVMVNCVVFVPKYLTPARATPLVCHW